MTPSREAGDGPLMLEDHSSQPIATRLQAWAGTLPPFAAEVVSRSDLTRPHVYVQLDATPHQVRVARSEITRWTGQVGFPEADGQDIVLATDEAISNAVEHAYQDSPGTLTLFAACTQLADAVRIIVSDHGVWRLPRADPGFRGRGLAMMERLAQVFRIVRTPLGTTVVLGWPLPG